MITKFNIFENITPDLRQISEYVKCIKNFKKIFKKDKIYKIKGIFGDPQGAIEKYNIIDYVPIECIFKVEIYGGDDNKTYNFYVGQKNNQEKFFHYFEIMEESNIAKKYNL